MRGRWCGCAEFHRLQDVIQVSSKGSSFSGGEAARFLVIRSFRDLVELLLEEIARPAPPCGVSLLALGLHHPGFACGQVGKRHAVQGEMF